jgi:adenine-specific DNA-methyltransferase
MNPWFKKESFMPSTEQLRSRLMKKLSELFQLDQPDLDFGFYRIMHAKAREIQEFIHTDLLKIVEHALGSADGARRAELQEVYENAVREAIEEYGVAEPEKTPKVQKAKAALDSVNNTAGAEADIYDHLYRFFERYYDSGDFISRRYFTRETSGKSAPYAVPYNGEEVKLHWANADQYYIKSAEYFSSFTFDLRQAGEVRAQGFDLFESSVNAEGQQALKVHFKVKEATEGEHGNLKAGDQTRRFFIIHKDRPVTLDEAGELICHFEYRPDPEKSGQDSTWREKRNAEAVETILNALETPEWLQMDTHENTEKQYRDESVVREYLRLFKVPAPTGKNKKRPLLARYLNQYTARNTMDYFIHKDLGGFLRRELDFYIKNEIMHLDDLENADVPSVESYLAKIRVLRKIAAKLIDFLAQLEDFQKKLWLKKKFVVETNYGITLDRVPEDLYPEVAANEAQCEEWIELFAIDEIQADLHYPGFSRPLTVEFLKANNNLVLDTRFFDEDFKARLVTLIENFDEQCDGLLIHSENFQALNLLQERYREPVKCVYIDPPYNTGGDGFLYRDQYQHSSWLTMIGSCARVSQQFMNSSCGMFVSIDEGECDRARFLFRSIFGEQNIITSIIWQKKYAPANDAKWFSENHDYLIVIAKHRECWFPKGLPRSEKQDQAYKNYDNDPRGRWRTDNYVSNKNRFERPNSWYPISHPKTGEEIWPSEGAVWRYSKEMHEKNVLENRIWWGKNGLNKVPAFKRFLSDVGDIRPQTIWKHEEVGHNQDGVREIQQLFGGKCFSSPKPVGLINQVLKLNDSLLTIDYFAGSGTTGHAVINLNREDTLNNLRFDEDPRRKKAVSANPSFREDYMLRYLLDVETRGSQSLLNIDAFADPTAYTLEVKKPGTDQYVTRAVDLIETFNYLIGLRVVHTAVPQTFQAAFKRIPDPELPKDPHTRLAVDGRVRQDADGPWWFRKIEGRVPGDPADPGNGQQDKVLIVWRKLTSDIEQDNLMLDEWFQKNRISTRDFEFDTIYVNGSNNLPSLRQDGENWKVRLIEEEFMKRMWDMGGV